MPQEVFVTFGMMIVVAVYTSVYHMYYKSRLVEMENEYLKKEQELLKKIKTLEQQSKIKILK